MTLHIDTQSDTWRIVSEYARERIRDLSLQCTRLGTEPGERERLAARIHELELLVEAPRQILPLTASGSIGGSY